MEADISLCVLGIIVSTMCVFILQRPVDVEVHMSALLKISCVYLMAIQCPTSHALTTISSTLGSVKVHTVFAIVNVRFVSQKCATN